MDTEHSAKEILTGKRTAEAQPVMVKVDAAEQVEKALTPTLEQALSTLHELEQKRQLLRDEERKFDKKQLELTGLSEKLVEITAFFGEMAGRVNDVNQRLDHVQRDMAEMQKQRVEMDKLEKQALGALLSYLTRRK
jgi:DNA repair ATPase RecN